MKRRGDDPEEFDGTEMRGRRHDRPNGPWWTRWGLLGVVILALLAVVTGMVPSALTQTQKAVEQTREEIQTHAKRQEETSADVKRAAEEQVKLLRLLCVSLARTDDSRERCLR